MAGSRSTANRSRRGLPFLATALLLLGFGKGALADDWGYRVRPGDTLWDFSAAHLKSGYRWQQLQAYNHIADPYHLPPGLRLRVPLTWLRAAPAQAKVVAVSGSATVRIPGRSPIAALAGQKLPAGTRIETDPDASLTLQFADGSRLLLRPDSLLELDRLSSFGGGAMVDTRLRLQRGRITNTVRKQPGGGAASFRVDTPNASSAVRGTVFRVDAEEHGTQAEVLEGSVAVSSGSRKTLVTRGYGAAVSANARDAIRAVKLLPAPNLSGLPKLQKARPELAWPAVQGAREYRVQVSATPDFASLLVDKPYPDPKAVLPALNDGDYVIRVNAVDANGLEGRDAVARISVQGQPEPPYAIAPVAGSTVKDKQPSFRWSGVADAGDYVVEVASDAAFTQPVASARELRDTEFHPAQPLAPGAYYWRVASRDRNGKVGPFGDPLPFTFKPLPEVSEIGAGDDGGKPGVTFRWQEGDASQRYRFQLSRTADFAAPKIDQIVEDPQITVPRLRGGTWYVRAQTIDADGYEGPFPTAQTVEVPCRACRILAGSGALLILLSL